MSKIYFFNYHKRPNSTARPLLSSGTMLSCRIKDASSLAGPVLEIHQQPLFEYTYCYIQDFKRYYFIDDAVLDQNVWTVYTHVDVLATFKYDITGSSQYVIRSASYYNANLIDSYYSTVVDGSASKVAASKYKGVTIGGVPDPDYVRSKLLPSGSMSNGPYFNRTVQQGYFVVGVVGNNATGTTFYRMDYNAFRNFIHQTFLINPSDMSDVSTGIGNAIYDPISYITMCRWYPQVNVPSTSTGTNTIRVGRYSCTLTGTNLAYVMDSYNTEMYYISIDIPKHPDAASRPYLNLAPFSTYELYFEPFGVIPIDSTRIYGQNELTVEWIVDYCTGTAQLKVAAFSSSDDGIIYATTSDYGVEIPISSLRYDWKAGAILSATQFIKESYSSGIGSRSKPVYMSNDQWESLSKSVSENGGNNVTALLNGVQDVTASALGQLATNGSSGSFICFNSGVPVLYAWHQNQTTYNDARFGRPYEARRTLSDFSGYVLCGNAEITSFTDNPKPMAGEYSAIIQYLNTGVYIE